MNIYLLKPTEMLQIYEKLGTFDKCAISCGCNRKTWSRLWYEKGLPDPKNIKKEAPKYTTYSIAAVADMHWGSNYERMDAFDNFISIVKSRGITTLLNCGDTIEGLMKRQGADKTRFLHSIDDIMDYAEKHYPTGFKNNILINGNHCNSLDEKGDGFNFAQNLTIRRPDLTTITNPAKMVTPIEVDGGAKIALYHGVGGCAQNLTGRTRNLTCRLIDSGADFDILLCGHCHRPSDDKYLGKYSYSCACFEDMTPYLADKMLVPEIGGLILTYDVAQNGKLTNVRAERPPC